MDAWHEIEMLEMEQEFGLKGATRCQVLRIATHDGCEYLSEESINLIQVLYESDELVPLTACMCMTSCDVCGGTYNCCARLCMYINRIHYIMSSKLVHEVTCQQVPLTQQFVKVINRFAENHTEVIRRLNEVRIERTSARDAKLDNQWDSDDF